MSDDNNMRIWDRVWDTPDEFTKKVPMRGGFTAIDPAYQLKKATELWGPCGDGWGLCNVKWSHFQLPSGDVIMMVEAELFYPAENRKDGKMFRGLIPVAVDAKFRDCTIHLGASWIAAPAHLRCSPG